MDYFELLTNNLAHQQTLLLTDNVCVFALRLYALNLLCLQVVVGSDIAFN